MRLPGLALQDVAFVKMLVPRGSNVMTSYIVARGEKKKKKHTNVCQKCLENDTDIKI